MTDTETDAAPQREFKAEIKQLLEILIHSVYTSKDIFVRELISNAADALEKVRFRQAAGEDLCDADLPLEIRIDTDQENCKLLISDTGIGMTAAEVEQNIGTIAHSGATAFIERLKEDTDRERDHDLSLIGRFGVGFYSVFMAADQVVLTSRTADQAGESVAWTSDGAGTYTLEELSDAKPRGTSIELRLKEADKHFADETELKGIIKRYSNFIPFPILVNGEQVNQTTALWREPPHQIKSDQYEEFYKLVSHDYQEPLLTIHHSVDAPLQFASLLFVPKTNPEAMGFGEGEVNLQLYVQRVLIDGENKNCLPKYLRFVRGVVESEDLPLNVSRETLQQNRVMSKIRENLTRKVLDQLLKLADQTPEKYHEFWKAFHRILKEGYNDSGNRDKFQELLRFNASSHEDDGELTSLKEYVERMPESQQEIYYLSGPSREALRKDPRLELFRKNKIEVLYLYEVADEFVLGSLGKYQDKKLVSADQAKAEDLGGGETAGADEGDGDPEEAGSDINATIERFKEILADRVKDVRVSSRLVDSPACLVGDDDQLSGHMEKMMRMMSKSEDLPQRVLELNATHPLIQNVNSLIAEDTQHPFVTAACEQLFEGSMLLDGYLTDPHTLVERMNRVLGDAAALYQARAKPADQ